MSLHSSMGSSRTPGQSLAYVDVPNTMLMLGVLAWNDPGAEPGNIIVVESVPARRSAWHASCPARGSAASCRSRMKREVMIAVSLRGEGERCQSRHHRAPELLGTDGARRTLLSKSTWVE